MPLSAAIARAERRSNLTADVSGPDDLSKAVMRYARLIEITETYRRAALRLSPCYFASMGIAKPSHEEIVQARADLIKAAAETDTDVAPKFIGLMGVDD